MGQGVTETGATSLAGPGAGGAAGSAAAVGIGFRFAADGAEYDSGAVHAGFGFVQFDGRRHWQRHHEFLQFLFVAGGQSHR